MEIITDIKLEDFKFWAGAQDTIARLTIGELRKIENLSEDLWTIVPNETMINDLFWHDTDEICSYLGIDEDEFWEREPLRKPNERETELSWWDLWMLCEDENLKFDRVADGGHV